MTEQHQSTINVLAQVARTRLGQDARTMLGQVASFPDCVPVWAAGPVPQNSNMLPAKAFLSQPVWYTTAGSGALAHADRLY